MINKIDIIFYFSSFVLFSFFISLGFLSYPQEDALILYRYANNLAETGAISFNLNGSYSEGATDFLWLLILSLLSFLGFDPYFSTALISTICFFIILKIFRRDIFKSNNIFFYILFVFVLLNMGQVIGSSLYGFSSVIFCTIGLLTYYYAFKGKLYLWCLFSVIFCLFRPEAFIFFLPTIYVAFKKALRQQTLKLFLVAFSITVLFGIIYIFWRYNYFGTALPLPLIVKQHGGELSLIRYFATLSQFISTLTISLLIPVVYGLFIQKREFYSIKNDNFITFLLLIFSCFLYLFSLSTGYQSQNIFFRYFAPLYFIVFIISFYSLSQINKKYLFYIFSVIIVIGSLDNSNLMNRLLNIESYKISNPTTNISREFSDKAFSNHPLVSIANTLSKKHNSLSMMITEAGALPYVTGFFTYDLVGLNTKRFALKPVKCDDILEFKPDFIEIDIGPINNLFNFKAFEENELIPSCRIFNKEIMYNNENIIKKDKLMEIQNYDHYTDPNLSHQNASTFIAAQNILFCLANNDYYTNVFTNKKSDQIYFLSDENNNLAESFIDSCDYEAKGYFLR